MCASEAVSDAASDGYVYDPESLSAEQCTGDACVACHTRWPRPRIALGLLPDGAPVFGCGDCAALIGAGPLVAADSRVFAAR
ncbi:MULTISPECIES: hypothetical protein [Nocardiopsis]|uniref:Uncharacterized protein n=1 Tax=Nocardiopsis lambiniae TaxID=3075539 RepID=A0ABU2MF98_9ACTN|nr:MULTISPECIES: hypothetical protein [unclassified Nocardiopsis]MDE3720942.1 hypothetical protein [Nocardiopsis sp. N85]MDT0331273.1 hypothetical protein [Nocardiopsis sp. DSM 44743]